MVNLYFLRGRSSFAAHVQRIFNCSEVGLNPKQVSHPENIPHVLINGSPPFCLIEEAYMHELHSKLIQFLDHLDLVENCEVSRAHVSVEGM